MSESELPPPAEQPTPAKQPSVTKSVSEAQLQLRTIRLDSLICSLVPGSPDTSEAEVILPECKGELVDGSLSDEGFRARVSWSVRAGRLAITGAHVLTFSVGMPSFAERDARYYSVINSVILAYPYIRQVIDDLSVKCLGGNLIVRTLDVPKFVQERTKTFLKLQELQGSPEQTSASGNGDEGN